MPADDLEPGRATLEAWLAALGAFGLDAIDDLDAQPASGGSLGRGTARPPGPAIPEAPLSGGLARVQEVLTDAMDGSLLTTGGGYLAYVPGGGLPTAAFADLVGGLTNRFTGLAAAAPGLCRLEADVLAWLAEQFGYGARARGLLTSGGSLANFTAVVTARHDRLGEGADLRRATAYTSSQVHHSVRRSVRLAGIPGENLRSVAVDEHLRMAPQDLARAVAEDRARGLRPFLVVSSAGTTNTGAIDPLPAIADLCAREGLWHHVDGAYGGAFVLCPEGRARLSGIERADSITFDPHKGMFLPYGTGCLLVADGQALARAHAEDASYLQDFEARDRRGEPPSPTDLGPELSRDFRGLRLWLPLMLHGAGAFRRALSEKLELAADLHRELAAEVTRGLGLELLEPPQTTVVAFRAARRPKERLEEWNARSAALLDAICARERVYLSSTSLPVPGGAAFTLRACFLSFRTHRRHARAAVEDIVAAARQLDV